MKAQQPPAAPHGPHAMMKAYNDLRNFIMLRQVKDVVGTAVSSKQIITTKSGRLVQWHMSSLGGGGPGACCIAGACSIATEAACHAAGGVYFGPDTTCTITTCSGIGTVGACCHGTSCMVTTDLACIASGGVFIGGACTPTLCSGCPGGMGACCDTIGGCTQSPPGTCGGVFHCGAACETVTCVPTEPDGACCQTPTSICEITPESECHGIFHEFIDCSFIGSCEHDFCGPTNWYCACPPNPGYPEQFPTPVCCPDYTHVCRTCVSFEVVYCCCCNWTPYGWVCL